MSAQLTKGQIAYAVGISPEYVVTVREIVVNYVYHDLVVADQNESSWRPDRVYLTRTAADTAAEAKRQEFARNRRIA